MKFQNPTTTSSGRIVMAERSPDYWLNEHSYLAGGARIPSQRSAEIWPEEHGYMVGEARLFFRKVFVPADGGPPYPT